MLDVLLDDPATEQPEKSNEMKVMPNLSMFLVLAARAARERQQFQWHAASAVASSCVALYLALRPTWRVYFPPDI
jgi:hypothetical protein